MSELQNPSVASSNDNFSDYWRDEVNSWPNDNWSCVSQGGAIVAIDGNAAGSRYVKCTLDPRDPSSRVDITGSSSLALRPPMRAGFGVSLSRRSQFQQFLIGMGAIGSDGVLADEDDTSLPVELTGGVTVATNVATFTSVNPHNYSVGTRISVFDVSDPRMCGFFTITGIPTATTFSIALSFANGTYGSGGYALYIPAALNVKDFIGVIADDMTAGNAKLVSRSTGAQRYVRTWNPSASLWDSAVTPSGYAAANTYPAQARSTLEILHEGDWAGALVHAVDTVSVASSSTAIDQQLPTPSLEYIPRMQWRNLPHQGVPKTITTAVKAGSATATITAPGHGLTVSSWVSIWGIRDQAAFANFSTAIQVASVIDSDTFTITFGISTTATSYGGFVVPAVTGLPMPYLASSSVQSIGVSASGRLLLQFLESQGNIAIGESVCFTGIVDSSNVNLVSYEGIYRVASTNTTLFQVELEPLQGQELPGGTIVVGGALMGAPDFRLHFARGRAHGRVAVEIESGRAHGRVVSSVPVAVNGGSVAVSGTAAVNISQVSGGSASSALDPSGTSRILGTFLGAGTLNADKTSAAITIAGSTAATTAGAGQVVAGAITVTGAGGTSPTLDITLEESYDGGTTWQKVYDVQRITGNGVTLTPPMLLHGRMRWTWTAPGGSSATFTTAIATMRSSAAAGVVRQLFDRSIAPNTLNSASAALYVEGCSDFGLVVVSGAGATTAPVYRVELSPDGSYWWAPSETVTGNASTIQATSISAPFSAKWARIKVYTAGVAAVQTYALLTAKG